MSQKGPKGQLSKYSIEKLLKWIKQKNKTGLLQLKYNEKIRHLFFKKGDLFHAKSNSPKDKLGQYLIQHGKITTEQYQKAVKVHLKTRKKLGKVLLAMKMIEQDELFLILRKQVREIVQDCFGWFDGEFFFFVNKLPSDDPIPFSFNLENLIKDGLKRRKAWAKMRKYFPSTNDIFITNNNISIQDVLKQLSNEDREILLLIDGVRTYDDICTLSRFSDFKTTTTLISLIERNVISRLGEEEAELPTTKGITEMEDEKTAVDEETVEEDTMEEEAATEMDEEVVSSIDELSQKIDDMNYYQVLDLQTTASEEEIKKAYYTLAKDYHPDRYHDETLKPKLTKIFEKIKEAHEVLGDNDKKLEYDRKMGFVEDEAAKREKRQKMMAETQFKLGMKKYQLKQYKLAIDFFQSAIDMNPEIGSYFGMLGEALAKFPTKHEESKKMLKQANSIEPNNPQWLLALGTMLKNQGNYNEAENYFRSVLKLDSENQQAIAALKAMNKPLKKEVRFEGIIRKDIVSKD